MLLVSSGAGLAAVALAAVARAGPATTAVGLVRLPVRLLALEVAVAGRANARSGPAALACSTGVGGAACRARPKQLQVVNSLNVAVHGGGHHEDLGAVRVLGEAEQAVYVAQCNGRWDRPPPRLSPTTPPPERRPAPRHRLDA